MRYQGRRSNSSSAAAAVGQAVAKAARLLDFNVTVIDDRTEFASRDKFPIRKSI
ncbi:MAG: hypothetical protein IPL01_12585 [Acidobacteria bacterium]|nr:hypothetical protein [Acidobacteriota bacterium]